MNLPKVRRIVKPILSLIAFVVLLVCLIPQAGAQRVRSTVRRIQAEQRQRNAQIVEQAARRQKEHERRLQEWKRWEERQKKALRRNRQKQ
jgi:predicted Holliday junction resolvase-like endonuclease